MENFRTPYYSLSVSEFWRRWHISLSTWFKDYVYIPLGGSRVDERRHIINLLVTFGLSGLWHGANWTYLSWGILNGLYLVVGWLTKDWRSSMFNRLGWRESSLSRRVVMQLSTFLLICIAWIVFRAQNLGDAGYVMTHIAHGWDSGQIKTPHFLLRQLPVAIAAILALEFGQVWSGKISFRSVAAQMPRPARWALYAAFVVLVVMFGVYQNAQFIYFQF
jgi:D-alanyl-lipoteichoic acid acyltransferase DltB (MBOAT superfamily)